MSAAKVIPLRRTREVDVIVRRAPGHPDLRDQVGILFIDCRPDGTPYEVTFEPIYQKLRNVVIAARDLTESDERVSLIDDDDGKRWAFEVNDINDIDEGDE